MCIKLAYLRSLVKTAIKSFCSRNRSRNYDNHSSENPSSYHTIKKENVNAFRDGEDSTVEQNKVIDVDEQARELIKGIIATTKIPVEYEKSCFELWKSLSKIKKFASRPLETQLLAAVLSMRYLQNTEKGYSICSAFGFQYISSPPSDDEIYCLTAASSWTAIKSRIKGKLLQYHIKVEEFGLEYASEAMCKMPDDFFLSFSEHDDFVKKACDAALEECKALIEEEEENLRVNANDCRYASERFVINIVKRVPQNSQRRILGHDWILDTCYQPPHLNGFLQFHNRYVFSDVERIKEVIQNVAIRANLDTTYNEEAYQLWCDLTHVDSFTLRDFGAQAESSYYAVASIHFYDTDFHQYTDAPHVELRRCMHIANKFYRKKSAQDRWNENYNKKLNQ